MGAEDLFRTYIVIPAFNEESTLGDVLEDLESACSGAQRVVVDDGSSDHTAAVASARPVHLLRHVTNLGQGAALRTGVEYSLAQGAEVIITFDADGQHIASDIYRLREAVISGSYDVALGTRFGEIRPSGLKRTRWIVLKLGVGFTRLSARLAVTDTYNGLRAFSRKAAEEIAINQDGMAHGLEILYAISRLRLQWTEVPVHIRYTEYSRSKGLSSAAAVDILADVWGSRR